MSSRSTPILRKRSRFHAMNSYSTDSSNYSGPGGGSFDSPTKSSYRILVLGSPSSGKTSIIKQFLYDQFTTEHNETMDDMYRGEFEDTSGNIINFDIQDVGGRFVYDFPSMGSVSIKSADAFIIVVSLSDPQSWEEAYNLREMIIDAKDSEVPIVVVANKSDLEVAADIPYDSLEATVIFDWENGFVEASARTNRNIRKIFKELLNQAKPRFGVHMPINGRSAGHGFLHQQRHNLSGLLALQEKASKDFTEQGLRRRLSLPMAPPVGSPPVHTKLPDCIEEENQMSNIHSEGLKSKSKGKRRSSFAALRRDSCRVS